jgi:hypothetical protein
MPTLEFQENVNNGYEIDGTLLFEARKNIGIDLVVGKGTWKLKNGVDGKIEEWSLLAGIRFFVRRNSLFPFASFRIGVQSNKLKLNQSATAAIPIDYSQNFSHGTNLAVQFGGGFLFRISKKISLENEINFRFVRKSTILGLKAVILYTVY